MSLLTDGLPNKLLGVPVRTDFRVMLRLEQLMQDEELPEQLRYAGALDLFYAEPVADVQAAWDKLWWFYHGGEAVISRQRKESGGAGKNKPRLCDFEQDAELIFAAFLGQYGIDLVEIEYLHWWKFRALFQNLDEQQQISRIMGWRGADTKNMSKRQAAEYKRLKRYWALEKTGARAMTLAERDQMMKAEVDRMFAKARDMTERGAKC